MKSSPCSEHAGKFLFLGGAVFFALSAALGLLLGFGRGATGDLVIVGGCLLSWLFSSLTRTPSASRRVWIPAFGGFWLGSIILLSHSGGIRSPYFAESLILLFLAAMTLQERPAPKRIGLFVALNFAFWGLLSIVHLQPLPQNDPDWLVVLRLGILTGASLFLAWSLVARGGLLRDEAEKDSERLAEIQAQLAHTDRMAHLGSLAASTAHELAQPVQIIQNATALLGLLLKRGTSSGLDIQHLVRQISDGSSRLSRLLTQIRDYARKDLFQPSVFDLREAVQATELLAGPDLLKAHGIEVRWQLPETPLWVNGDSLMLQQVLLNLLNNARDGAKKSARPEIEVKATRLSSGDAEWVRLTVSNNGPAIPITIQSRIFDTFFTTKSRGKGTGLGLMVVSSLIEHHQGRIFFGSEENRTLFVVDIPSTPAPVEAEASPV